MPESHRRWSEEDISELKSLAGKMPVGQIAAKLGRSEGAVMVEASKLKLSLRVHRTQHPQTASA
ncbi:hypothetical protein ABIB94_001807 [Bradyrhizobium sp. JR7.2]|nr:hypothetical protein [Bradyrhizobium japonicum]MCP1780371.1 hypothetical protein [Bradyrhizobium japonicum]MCP1859721.1 hypothetical protein [Bradyrhizobium japonicum]MCP1890487.1 hypothetical protein [Bradyrhizobium japonicum]MCP1956635.1 hypothetical protein [Bradyrhizobium japonicum]